MKRLETPRLVLRSWEITDVDDLYEYASNPKVGPMAGWTPHTGREESFLRVASFIQKDEVWAIEHKEDKKVIGSLGLHADSYRSGAGSRMIGYVLAEPYWGQGLMPEAVRRVLAYAFEELELDVVSVRHFTFNGQSKRVIEKCGFRFEGIIRHARVQPDGNSCDSATYSMLRSEYEPYI